MYVMFNIVGGIHSLFHTNRRLNFVGTSATAVRQNNADGDNISTLSERAADDNIMRNDDNPAHSNRSATKDIGIQVLYCVHTCA